MASGTQDQKIPAVHYVARLGRHRSRLSCYDASTSESQQKTKINLFNNIMVEFIHVSGRLCADIVNLAKPKP
jgi:hypothetical protein